MYIIVYLKNYLHKKNMTEKYYKNVIKKTKSSGTILIIVFQKVTKVKKLSNKFIFFKVNLLLLFLNTI